MKRSQMALEFMMTYGWAIMVAMVAISAVAYFGVLNPDRFFPTACILESGIGCTDFKVNEGSVILILKNARGEDISISEISARNCSGSASGQLNNGEQGIFIGKNRRGRGYSAERSRHSKRIERQRRKCANILVMESPIKRWRLGYNNLPSIQGSIIWGGNPSCVERFRKLH